MSNLADLLITLVCAALGAGLAVLSMNVGGSAGLSAVAGLGLFIVGSQLQNVGARRRDRAALEKELVALKRADLILSDQAAESVRVATERLEKAEAAAISREGAVQAEIKVLETLLRQFAESLARRLQAVEAAQARAVPRNVHPAPTAPAPASGGAAESAAEAPRRRAPDPALLAAVQRALMDNRIDLHLQPIVSLPQRKLKYYEALSRLRGEDGALIMPERYLEVAEAAGLMSSVDNLLLFRCVQFIRRVTSKQREVGVFCNVSLASLTDMSFFPQFVDFMRAHRDLAPQIVFELPQSAYDAMDEAGEASLRALSDLGFAFSMDAVTYLDFDMDALRRRSVRFVKASPALLLGQESGVAGGVSAEDLGKILGRAGVALIGERIETERDVVDLLDFDVAFGQGFLFGEPRPLREDQPEPPARAEPDRAAEEAPPAPTGMAALFQAREARRRAG